MQTNAERPVKHNPVTFYFRTLLYMFIGLLLRIAAFLPLVCLFVFPGGSVFRYGALLCPALLLFLILPLRFSFAEAMTEYLHTQYFSFNTALSTDRYTEKLTGGLFYLLSIAKWAIPLVAFLGYIYWMLSAANATFVLEAISGIGKSVTAIVMYVVVFVQNLFGNASTTKAAGGMVEGFYTLFAAIGLGGLIWLIGIVRNSASRYLRASTQQEGHRYCRETNRCVSERRGKQFLVAMLNMVVLLPFLYVAATSLRGTASDLAMAGLAAISTKTLAVPDFAAAAAPLFFAFLGIYMPLLPVRRYCTAAFAVKALRMAPSAVWVSAQKQSSGDGLPVSSHGIPSRADAVPVQNTQEEAPPEASAHVTPLHASAQEEETAPFFPAVNATVAMPEKPLPKQETGNDLPTQSEA